MRWFRRSKGRHALGAAVTALPSGPVAATWTPPPWDARTTSAPDRSGSADSAEPAATVPAGRAPAGRVPVAVVPAPVVPVPVPVVPVPVPVVAVPVLPPASVGTAVTIPTSRSVPASDVRRAETVMAQEPPEVAVADSRDELFDSIAALIASGEAWAQTPAATLVVPAAVLPVAAAVPVQAAPVRAVPVHIPAPEPHGTRVSIGFRDGTTAVLDRDSEQAAALEELAALLSLRD